MDKVKELVEWVKTLDLPQNIKTAAIAHIEQEWRPEYERLTFSQGFPGLPPAMRGDEWYITFLWDEGRLSISTKLGEGDD